MSNAELFTDQGMPFHPGLGSEDFETESDNDHESDLQEVSPPRSNSTKRVNLSIDTEEAQWTNTYTR